MIRKYAVTLILTVLIALSLLVSLPAIHVANHASTAAGSHPNIFLVDVNPTPTPSFSNPSGGGNSGG